MRTELGVVLHVPPENIADADVLHGKIVREQLGLRPLSAPLDSHDYELAHPLSLRRASPVVGHLTTKRAGTQFWPSMGGRW